QSIIGDVRDEAALRQALQESAPEIIFHIIVVALVPRCYAQPIETLATNIMGTAHLLDAIRSIDSVRSVVIVTSDKCYENQGVPRAYVEGDRMGGHDPYSASKGCAELVTAAFRRSYFDMSLVSIASARAGNV